MKPVLVASLAASLLGVALARDAATSKPAQSQRFVILYHPGGAWAKGKPVWDQDLGAHAQYMLHLRRSNKLVMGGPFTDDSGGLAIIDAADRAEAKSILAADPAVRKDVFKADLRPWMPVDWDHFGAGS